MTTPTIDVIKHTICNLQGSFDFELLVPMIYGCPVHKGTIESIYDAKRQSQRKNTVDDVKDSTHKKGVYALYYEGELKKIGQAADSKSGIFHRMSQYYRQIDGSSKYITKHNRDSISVLYFNLETSKDCWAAERFLQAIAFYMGESMPWEEKGRHSKGDKQ